MTTKKDIVQEQCSFCFKTADEVVVLVRSKLVSGGEQHCICDECVELCKEAMEEGS